MPIISHKRIKHLARYFGIIGFICLAAYSFTRFGDYFLPLLSPPIFLSYWLRIYGRVVTSFIPNEPLYNNLFLIFPATIIYFGLVGFEIKNIINERGKIRLMIAAAFIAFLAYIHYLSYKEIRLYLAKPAAASTHLAAASDVPLGNDESQ